MTNKGTFDVSAARARCRQHRRRILDISQTVSALHIAPAFSCMEIVDTIYYGLMRRDRGPNADDSFIISKGHGSLAQYAVLESLGIVSKAELDLYGKPGGRFATHPDYGLPGIEASTGSLGHGLNLAVGMAAADKVRRADRVVFVVGETNFRSQKALRKIGASFLKKVQLPGADGTMMPNLVFAIRRQAYLPKI